MDEAHERDMESILLWPVLQRELSASEMRVVVMSATFDPREVEAALTGRGGAALNHGPSVVTHFMLESESTM